jgi:hypothetical protein
MMAGDLPIVAKAGFYAITRGIVTDSQVDALPLRDA